jgi:hypothetical protein
MSKPIQTFMAIMIFAVRPPPTPPAACHFKDRPGVCRARPGPSAYARCHMASAQLVASAGSHNVVAAFITGPFAASSRTVSSGR